MCNQDLIVLLCIIAGSDRVDGVEKTDESGTNLELYHGQQASSRKRCVGKQKRCRERSEASVWKDRSITMVVYAWGDNKAHHVGRRWNGQNGENHIPFQCQMIDAYPLRDDASQGNITSSFSVLMTQAHMPSPRERCRAGLNES